ncbi:MAG: S26 family signal peptidase [Geminicoccaceae bacterium]
MVDGEIFALSTHVPNSLDSRQFGLIRSSQILGTYLPLIKFPRRTRNPTS